MADLPSATWSDARLRPFATLVLAAWGSTSIESWVRWIRLEHHRPRGWAPTDLDETGAVTPLFAAARAAVVGVRERDVWSMVRHHAGLV